MTSRNTDPSLRSLERQALQTGEPQVIQRVFDEYVRRSEHSRAATFLYRVGSGAANEAMLQLPLGGDRDRVAIELGKIVIDEGWLPNAPVGQSLAHAGGRELVWELPPTRLWMYFGRYKSYRIPAALYIWHPGGLGVEQNWQPPNFHFKWGVYRGRSLPHAVTSVLSRIGVRRAMQRIVPNIYYLYRWAGSDTLGDTPGFSGHYPANPAFFYEDSQRQSHERTSWDRFASPEEPWSIFQGVARIGLIPDEDPPPRHGLSRDEITEWLSRPERVQAIHALFYADMWLASDWLAANVEEYHSRSSADPKDPRLMLPPREAPYELTPEMFRNLHYDEDDDYEPRIEQPFSAGDVAYHGTSVDWEVHDMDWAAWVTDSYGVADYFVDWTGAEGLRRIIEYKFTGSPRLAVIEESDNMKAFVSWVESATGRPEGDLEHAGSEDLAMAVCETGLDGWHIPYNYPSGSDTLLCVPKDWLEFVSEELLGQKDEMENPQLAFSEEDRELVEFAIEEAEGSLPKAAKILGIGLITLHKTMDRMDMPRARRPREKHVFSEEDRELVEFAIEEAEGNLPEAAKILGIGVGTLHHTMDRMEIQRERRPREGRWGPGRTVLQEEDRELIRLAIKEAEGNLSKAAELLGVAPGTFHQAMDRLRMPRAGYAYAGRRFFTKEDKALVKKAIKDAGGDIREAAKTLDVTVATVYRTMDRLKIPFLKNPDELARREEFLSVTLPAGQHLPSGLTFDLATKGEQPLVYLPEGVQEKPSVTQALQVMLTSHPEQGLASPEAWDGLLAAAGRSAKVYVLDRQDEFWRVIDVDFDPGGRTGELVVRHLGEMSRHGDRWIDLKRAFTFMVPVVVYDTVRKNPLSHKMYREAARRIWNPSKEDGLGFQLSMDDLDALLVEADGEVHDVICDGAWIAEGTSGVFMVLPPEYKSLNGVLKAAVDAGLHGLASQLRESLDIEIGVEVLAANPGSATRVRETERRFRETGTTEDHAAWLAARVRTGELAHDAVTWAARLGDQAALLLESAKPVDWMDREQRRNIIDSLGDQRLIVSYTADVVERVLPIWEAEHPDDQRPGHAIDAARIWADDPSGENRQVAVDAARAAEAAAADAHIAAAADDVTDADIASANVAYAAADTAYAAVDVTDADATYAAAAAVAVAGAAFAAKDVDEGEWQRLRLANYVLEGEWQRLRLADYFLGEENMSRVNPRRFKERQLKVGARRGTPSVWLEGRWLIEAGFKRGGKVSVEIDPRRKRVTVEVDPAGSMTVIKRGERSGVLDITRKGLSALGDIEYVIVEHEGDGRLVIRPEASRAALEARQELRNMLYADLFSGAGILGLAASASGYSPAFAVDMDSRSVEVYLANREDDPPTIMWEDKIALLADYHYQQREMGRRFLPHVDLLVAGIPCTPWSSLRAGRVTAYDDELMATPLAFCQIVQYTYPRNIVIEEVPEFLRSDAWYMIRGVLAQWHYHVDWEEVDPSDLGLLCGRKRAVIVATSEPAPGLIESVLKRIKKRRPIRARQILYDPDEIDEMDLKKTQGGWFREGDMKGPGKWLVKLWEEAAATGEWDHQEIEEDDTRIGCIPAGYGKGSRSAPVVAHPDEEDTWRLLTTPELKSLHGIPQDYELTGFWTVDTRLIGQGVFMPLFREVIASLPGSPGTKRKVKLLPPRSNPADFLGDLIGDLQADGFEIEVRPR